MSDNSMVDLKPCPFCGSEAQLVGLYKKFVMCERITCAAEGPVRARAVDAIAAWNRRHGEPQP